MTAATNTLFTADDVDNAIDQLTVVREVYDQHVLQELAALLPYEVARDNKAILLEKKNDGSFLVGMCNQHNFVAIRNVARAVRISTGQLHPRFLHEQRFEVLLRETYDQTVAAPSQLDDHADDGQPEAVNWSIFETDSDIKLASAADTEPDIGEGTGMRAQAGKILLNAIAQRASDIHLFPDIESGFIQFRIDGIMYDAVHSIPPERMENIANAFCDMARVNGYEVMQRGIAKEITIKIKTQTGRIERRTLRFQGTPGQFGRNIVIRIQTNEFRDFDQIGLEPNQIAEIDNALVNKCGLVLVTGPTGSGKSNTLEAMLRRLEQRYQRRVKFHQLGNPIEFPNKFRHQVPLKDDDDWEQAFKESLRMDPNIVSPGEFRSSPEAAVVFKCAAAGHLTLTTVHTNNVAQTFSRLDSLNIDRDKQSALLKLILSQELVPLLCPHCKTPDPRAYDIAERLVEIVFPNRPDLKDAISSADDLPFFHKVGCRRCNYSGIRLRTCIAEAMTITPDISRMIRSNVDGQEIVDHAIRRHGMITLAEAAARKLCRGMIDYDDVMHLLLSPDSTAAPEQETYSWKSRTEDSAPPSADADATNNEYIDAEYVEVEYPEADTARAA
jgi:type IV pilus assembly protein PilB